MKDIQRFLMAGGVFTPQWWVKMSDEDRKHAAICGQQIRMQAAELIGEAVAEAIKNPQRHLEDELDVDPLEPSGPPATEDEQDDRALDAIAERTRRRMNGDEHLAGGATVEVALEGTDLGGYGGQPRMGA